MHDRDLSRPWLCIHTTVGHTAFDVLLHDHNTGRSWSCARRWSTQWPTCNSMTTTWISRDRAIARPMRYGASRGITRSWLVGLVVVVYSLVTRHIILRQVNMEDFSTWQYTRPRFQVGEREENLLANFSLNHSNQHYLHYDLCWCHPLHVQFFVELTQSIFEQLIWSMESPSIEGGNCGEGGQRKVL